MPFILAHISKSVSKSRLGYRLVPGKSEQYLRGDDSEPVAYIEAAISGNAEFIEPLIEESMLAIREVPRGWFIESRQG